MIRIRFKFKPLWSDDNAGLYGVVMLFVVLGVTSFIWLLCNTFLETFYNMMAEGYTKDFFNLLWVRGGILVIILLVAVFSLFMYMQKSKYSFGGGY